MGIWRYKGVDQAGAKVVGAVEVPNERELRKYFKAKGIRAKSVQGPTIFDFNFEQWLVEKGIMSAFGPKELMSFTKQLATLISAGITIIQALEILGKQQRKQTFKRVLLGVAADVAQGRTLSDALVKYPGFDKLYCNLVKAGEAGGILDTILTKLAQYMERMATVRRKIKGALIYPTIVVIVGIAVVSIMMIYVVPQMSSMLKDSGQELPWVTQTVVDISDFMRNYSVYLFPGLIVLAMAFFQFIKTSFGKPIWDQVSMKIPVFGGIIVKGNLCSFTQTMGTLLGAGVPLADSMEICEKGMSNVVMAKDLAQIRHAIVEGSTFSEPISRVPYFPDMVTQMVRVGEQTGNLAEMLAKVADIFEQEVNDLIDAMTAMIEPIIIIVLGGAVGFILIAMYLPMFMGAGGI
jgi:type IV pilus assembly protein PilC